MNQQIDIRASAIHVHAPISSYSLVFKHLRGSIIKNDTSGVLTYLCGGKEYSSSEVILLLTESAQPSPPSMLKGHTFATAAYVFGSPNCRGAFKVGVAMRTSNKGRVSNESIRRLAMTDAIGSLPTADRAYFHLTMSLMEGRDIMPIVKGALVSRAEPDRGILMQHLHSLTGTALAQLLMTSKQ